MQSRGLGIMGKAPVAGAVKTRLTPPLDGQQAALLYQAFLRDVLMVGLAVPECCVSLVYPPTTDESGLRSLLPPGVSLVPQHGAGLGEGLLGAFRQLWSRGASAVVLIGSDSPTLPLSLLVGAFMTMERGECDVVLGPADDGGYYLIGLRDDQPSLFDDIAWSTDTVMRQTLERAESLGLRVRQLDAWYDVDDAVSLARLVEELGSDPCQHAPATRAALQTLRRFGAQLPEPPIPWNVESTERRFASPWRNFDVDRLTTHTGAQIDYSYFTTPDAVWVVPVTTDGDIIFVRQYRAPVRDWCLEVPAGSVGDESLEATARRELREEVGATANDLRLMGAFYSASAHLTLRGHVFLALDVQPGDARLEETEMLVTVQIPARIAFDMARRGEINEGESALAVLFCEQAIRAHLAR
ncbi:MAG: TIGR04282 family arsenosugar biosynthesis glycosyltransferase [Chloroflexota bacterium]|nr:TIGR04282 family arsenosugar biosynthesis glycosyltransferase [Chloroflexota bacterium]